MANEVIQLPLKTWKKIERALLTLEEKVEMLSEEEACQLLGISKVTMINKVSRGEVPPSFYTKSPITGKRFYDKSKIIGLRKTT